MNILDCTLRDGGYRNYWHFSVDLIQNYLTAINNVGIKHVEMGLRLVEKNDSYGICAYCPDEFLENLNIPDGLEIAVMIKADEILAFGNPEKILNNLFSDSQNSPVGTIRVAVPYQKGLSCFKIIEFLKNKGYKTALNLTKTNPDSEKALSEIAAVIQNWDCLDVLYFADSFGVLNPADVRKFVLATKQVYEGSLGFHGHNNKGLAYKNALISIENDIDYIDSTVTGIGKGMGNLKTEEIIKEFPDRYDAGCLSDLVKFISMSSWGKIE